MYLRISVILMKEILRNIDKNRLRPPTFRTLLERKVLTQFS